MVTIRLNGEDRRFGAGDVAALVEQLGLDVNKIAVEKNREIVPRSAFADAPLREGDEVEIIQFVGGG